MRLSIPLDIVLSSSFPLYIFASIGIENYKILKFKIKLLEEISEKIIKIKIKKYRKELGKSK